MSSRPVLLVVGATEDDPPPGIDAAADRTSLALVPDAAAVADSIERADAIFAWRPEAGLLSGPFDRATRLRWIQSASAGVDELLFPALVESDVIVTNARGVFDDGIAETTLGFLLAFAKGFPSMFADQDGGRWEVRYSERLAGARLLVVGAGPIGAAIGRLARAFGMRVRGLARRARPADDVFERVDPIDALHAALGEADYVVDALPLTERTRRLFDRAAFAAMPPTARFVNIGRGATVHESALVEALRSGQIAGAALDVFETEPLPAASPLWGMDNVIVSPHTSGDVAGWEANVVGVFLDNLERWLADEPLCNVVDKRAGYPVS